jgi:predicted O-linked N-acetylglucosamine transferase (SPINDLY family)
MSLGLQKKVAGPNRKGQAIADLLEEARAYQALGRLADLQATYRKILRKEPSDFQILHAIGAGQHQAGDHEGAVRTLRRALVADPRSAPAHVNLGAALQSLNRIGEALGHYDKAIALQPDFVDAHFHRANVYLVLGQHAEAVVSYDRTLELKPDHAPALNNRGFSHKELRQLDAALADVDRSLALDPAQPFAWTNRGNILFRTGKYEEAIASFDKAISINPELQAAWLGAANVLVFSGRITEATAVAQRAVAIDPACPHSLTVLGQCHAHRAEADEALACFDRALAVDPGNESAISNKIFTLDFTGKATFEEQYRARSAWWNEIGSKIGRARVAHRNERDPARKLVVGYVSGDFRHMSPAFVIRPVLRNHDRSQFEVVCYSASPVKDDITTSFKYIADRWRDVSQWSDDQLVDAVRADGVDILVDLSGHTNGNRLRAFACKPAPVQVTAWGNATGTGAPVIDYLFSDPITIPAEARHLFAEKIWDLPAVIIIEPPAPDLRYDEPPCLTNGFISYGVFNRVGKFSDDAVAVWARVLHADPTGRILLKDEMLDDPSIRNVLIQRFVAHGVEPERIFFAGKTSREEHLRAYGQVDVCLDTFPQNGGVSTWEPLYMGVPVVTKLGQTVSNRAAGAIVSAVGLTDWVAADDDGYVRIATSATPDRLASLRRDLPNMIAATCGPATYTKAVEAAYRAMWQAWCAGAETAR